MQCQVTSGSGLHIYRFQPGCHLLGLSANNKLFGLVEFNSWHCWHHRCYGLTQYKASLSSSWMMYVTLCFLRKKNKIKYKFCHWVCEISFRFWKLTLKWENNGNSRCDKHNKNYFYYFHFLILSCHQVPETRIVEFEEFQLLLV